MITIIFENSANVINLVANSGAASTQLIPASDAINHLQENLGVNIEIPDESDAANDDNDSDSISNDQDNCPDVENIDQLDCDGDVCDNFQDDDFDGIGDENDNCPHLANDTQIDTDANGIGDVCDYDRPGDVYVMNLLQNLPENEEVLFCSDIDYISDCPSDEALNDDPDSLLITSFYPDSDCDWLGDTILSQGHTESWKIDSAKGFFGTREEAKEFDLRTEGFPGSCVIIRKNNADNDDDGIVNDEDNCPNTYNTSEGDSDINGIPSSICLNYYFEGGCTRWDTLAQQVGLSGAIFLPGNPNQCENLVSQGYLFNNISHSDPDLLEHYVALGEAPVGTCHTY